MNESLTELLQKIEEQTLSDRATHELQSILYDNASESVDQDVVDFVVHLFKTSEAETNFVDQLGDAVETLNRKALSALYRTLDDRRPQHWSSNRSIAPTAEVNPDVPKRRSRFDEMPDDFVIDTMPTPVSVDVPRRRQPLPPQQSTLIDDEPIRFNIYRGKVIRIKDNYATVELYGIRQRQRRYPLGTLHKDLVYSGQESQKLELILHVDQTVYVKVILVNESLTLVTMRNVDQETGEDLDPELGERALMWQAEEAAAASLASSAVNNQSVELMRDHSLAQPSAKRRRRREASPDMWEMQQLRAGALSAVAADVDEEDSYNEYDQGGDTDILRQLDNEVGYTDEYSEVGIDLEVREDVPVFMESTHNNIRDSGRVAPLLTKSIEPVKLVKVPEGPLNKAAVSGAQALRDRLEIQRQSAVEELEGMTESAVGLAWHDPLAEPGERTFAMEKREAAIVNAVRNGIISNQPEWRREMYMNTSFGYISNKSINDQRMSLPIYKKKVELLNAINSNQVIILIGETGSGKTTQITQYLYEEGYSKYGKIIGCTQPRRVAAISVANRVADEMDVKLGELVGYTVRFDDYTTNNTRIKYLTDGLLLRECLNDPLLSNYSVLIFDEAHERSIATDILMGLLLKTLKMRPELKLIITSATLDADRFSEFYGNCPIERIPGKTFPVEAHYKREPVADYFEEALITVMQIHLSQPSGDILLFLTGQEEIELACATLYDRIKQLGSAIPPLIVIPIYSSQPQDIQSRIFEPTPAGCRKCVIATNIAETSVTIDGIIYVIDPGVAKISAYDPKLGMDSLQVAPISQAQANQRMGRAGRTAPGKCFRLYTESAFVNEMLPTSTPAIQRENMSLIVLTLKAMGVHDITNFGFLDPPNEDTLVMALQELFALGALDEEGLITSLGRKMADFPLDPPLSRMLILSATELGCSQEILTIVAMTSEQSVFFRPKDKQAQADARKAKFHQPEGDHLTLLKVYEAWISNVSQNRGTQWCNENFIVSRRMQRIKEVRDQLMKTMARYSLKIVSCGRNYQLVQRALCTGLFRKAAHRDTIKGGYKTLLDGTDVFIHPGSSLFNRTSHKSSAEWVVYDQLVMTTKEYMHVVTAVDPKWLVEASPKFFKVVDGDKLSKRKQRERLEPINNPAAWRISRQKRSGGTRQTFG